MSSLTVPAFAKINLCLHITGKRPDGYHELATVFQTVDLHDRIRISTRSDRKITVSCSHPDVPGGPDNICHKAAGMLMQHTGRTSGVDVLIEKNIPVGAGLGGGSADAAAVLNGLNLLLGLDLSGDELCRIGSALGADVPFLIRGGTAEARGIGDILIPLPDQPEIPVLIVYPEVAVSTVWAYKNIKLSLTAKNEPISLSCFQNMADFGFTAFCANDFEPLVFEKFPVTAGWRNRLEESGALAARLSGSGSAVFGIFRSREEAEAARSSLDDGRTGLFVTRFISASRIADQIRTPE